MLKNIYDFFVGTYEIKAAGNTERFLNEMKKQGLKIFNLKKTEPLAVLFNIYRFDFSKIKNTAEQTHTEIILLKSHGLLHLLRHFRKRWGLAVGGLIFAALFFVLSLFIWDIQIKGCDKTTPEEVTAMLENAGFHKGALKSSLTVKKIENDFLKNNNKISWISVNLMGTTAYVEIREKEEKPLIADTSYPCSIYASRDGVIVLINAYMGYSVVSVGDTVTAGDLIVSGEYTDKYGENYRLHSHAKVMAFTTHTYTVTVPLAYTEHLKTGKSTNKYSLKLTRFNIPLYFNKNILYNDYDITTSETQLRFGKNFALPISVVKHTYTEVEKVTGQKSEQAALELAYERLYDFEYNLVGITVKGRSYEKTVTDDAVTVKVILDCYEDIGVKKNI